MRQGKEWEWGHSQDALYTCINLKNKQQYQNENKSQISCCLEKEVISKSREKAKMNSDVELESEMSV